LDLHFDNILFEVILHIGTLIAIAIVIVYYKDVIDLIIDGISIIGRFFRYIIYKLRQVFFNENIKTPKTINDKDKKFVILIVVESIPTAIMGVVLERIIIKTFNILLV
jgi:undecaprenyl-diphosphatase